MRLRAIRIVLLLLFVTLMIALVWYQYQYAKVLGELKTFFLIIDILLIVAFVFPILVRRIL
ncbi:MAG: hypothetical protein DRN81_02780 [Thermoproteota archaeon]|nr:MAG: hypothetical protein DRN81_02780 [Candidatus Korarchaeota archaeon]